MALVLSERGFGSIPEIMRMRTDLVMDAWDYVAFTAQYAETEAAINQKEP